MAVQFRSETLDQLLAPGISSLTAITIPDISGKAIEEKHWLQNHFLNSAVGPARYGDSTKQAVLTFLYRTGNAFHTYHRARERCAEFIAQSAPGRPASRLYFEALSEWEVVIWNLQIVNDALTKFLAQGVAEESTFTKVRMIGNRIKHFAEDIRDGYNSGSMTLPMWIETDGLACRTGRLSFVELSDFLLELAREADQLQLPRLPGTPAA